MYWLWTGPSYYPASVSGWKSITSGNTRELISNVTMTVWFSHPLFEDYKTRHRCSPLPGSIFVHNRLTHSLEVSCVGRSLGNNVAKGLMQKYPDGSINFPEIGSIVSAACLAHDMGNPPFGHSGERAISAYFSEGNGRKLEEKVRKERGRWEDFVHFEGNANAMRLLTHQFIGRRKGDLP